jgi:alkylation response protein AidB-like acyl-CoA dehydrogenase
MNFELTDDQKMIRQTAKDYVKKELGIERARKMRADEVGWSRDVWKKMGELGWLGISLPESVGGFGGSFVDASLILGELGATLVSEPYIASAIVAGHALLGAGNAEQHERWLAPMVAGDKSLALAHGERDSRFEVAQVGTTARKTADGWRLTGEKVWVDNGHAADFILVSARTSGGQNDRRGISLFLVEAGDSGLTRTTVRTMDGRRAAMLRFDCELGADRLLGSEGDAVDVLERALDLGAAATCAEGAAVMRAALAMTVEYLKTREQFGVKIGSFQALQHRAVDMFVEAELGRSVAIMAAIKVDDADVDERRRAISAAKVQLSVSGKYVSQQAIQLHGGIGVTEEHDIGLYFKRMHVLGMLYGDEEHHVARYAGLPGFTEGL